MKKTGKEWIRFGSLTKKYELGWDERNAVIEKGPTRIREGPLVH